MNPPILPEEIQSAITRERLRLLSLAFYISGAIGAVMVSFLLIHLALFAGFSFMPESAWTNGHKSASQEPPPAFIFRFAAMAIGFVIVCGWALGGLTAYAGHCIAHRENRVFVLVMAAINCIWIPYGTLLGIATFLLLSTPGAKSAFETGQAPAAKP